MDSVPIAVRQQMVESAQAAVIDELADTRQELAAIDQAVAAVEGLLAQAQAKLAVVEAIDPDRLEMLADYLDLDDARHGNTGREVQDDLRRWARMVREARGSQGEAAAT